MELATPAQMPTEPCNVHGEGRPTIIADAEIKGPEAPRAEAAADLSEVKPIALKGPTLLAQNDPYNSVKSTTNSDVAGNTDEATANQPSANNEAAVPGSETSNQTAEAKRDDEKPVLRAIPVQPPPEETPVEIRRAVPVGPMDEVDQGALLKAAAPSPGNSDE